MDAEKLRIVVIEALDLPGALGTDHVFADETEKRRREREVGDHDPSANLLARIDRVL